MAVLYHCIFFSIVILGFEHTTFECFDHCVTNGTIIYKMCSLERLTIELISYRSIFRQQATAGGGEGGGLEPGFELEQQDDDDL